MGAGYRPRLATDTPPKNKGHTIGMPLVVVPLQLVQALSCPIGDHHCLLAASSRKDQARTRLTLLP